MYGNLLKTALFATWCRWMLIVEIWVQGITIKSSVRKTMSDLKNTQCLTLMYVTVSFLSTIICIHRTQHCGWNADIVGTHGAGLLDLPVSLPLAGVVSPFKSWYSLSCELANVEQNHPYLIREQTHGLQFLKLGFPLPTISTIHELKRVLSLNAILIHILWRSFFWDSVIH